MPNLAGWRLRMRRPHPQSHVTLRYRGHMTNKNITHSLTQGLWTPNLAGWWLRIRETPTAKSRDTSIVWSRSFCSSHLASKGEMSVRASSPLIIQTQKENKRDLTYQQHLGEWVIPLSEPSCFSYNHTLKLTKNCLFLKHSNALFF